VKLAGRNPPAHGGRGNRVRTVPSVRSCVPPVVAGYRFIDGKGNVTASRAQPVTSKTVSQPGARLRSQGRCCSPRSGKHPRRHRWCRDANRADRHCRVRRGARARSAADSPLPTLPPCASSARRCGRVPGARGADLPPAPSTILRRALRARPAPRDRHGRRRDRCADRRLDGARALVAEIDCRHRAARPGLAAAEACVAPGCSLGLLRLEPGGRGRWCTMSVCGSGQRVRAYRARSVNPMT